MISTAQFRIYVACLAAYNNGHLHGKWIDIDGKDVDQVRDEIKQMLLASPVAEECEEWAIHDHEGFKPLHVTEWHDLQELCDYAECVENSTYETALIGHVIGERLCTAQEAIDFLDDNYLGEHKSLEYWAEDFMEETCQLDALPKNLRFYFDFSAMARDMELNSEIMSVEADNGNVHVMWWN